MAFLTFLLSICISNDLIIKIFWQGRTGLDICSMGAFEAIWRAWMGASPPTFYALAQGFPLSLAQIHILERHISKDKTNVLCIYSRCLFIFWSLNFSWRKFHLLETLTCKVNIRPAKFRTTVNCNVKDYKTNVHTVDKNTLLVAYFCEK